MLRSIFAPIAALIALFGLNLAVAAPSRPDPTPSNIYAGAWFVPESGVDGGKWKIHEDQDRAFIQLGGEDEFHDPLPGFSSTIDSKFPLELDPAKEYTVSVCCVYEAKPVPPPGQTPPPPGYPLIALANCTLHGSFGAFGDLPILTLVHTVDGVVARTEPIAFPGYFTGAQLNASGFGFSLNAVQFTDGPARCVVGVEITITER